MFTKCAATTEGGVDVTAWVLAQALGEGWGQQLIVENRAGAGAIIGTDVVAKSAPDGYTLLIATSGHALLPVLYCASCRSMR